MKQKMTLFALATILIFFVACNENQNKMNEKAQKSKTEQTNNKEMKKDCDDVHWTHHSGETGPENWKNLCDGFADCGGSSQSPVDIITADVVEGKELAAPIFKYGKSKVDIINNSHTVQFNISGENTVNLNGKTYKLLQFHYHALSEHTIDGKHFPIEVHFVHKHSDTDFAVIGFMFVEGQEYDLFSKYLDKFPTSKGEYKSDDTIDLLSLLPENKSYYYYSGSLTTPPCTEVVSWYVLKNPVEASKKQIEAFSKILNNNYRPVQPLNNRKIEIFRQ
ncbi:carbonic anhydrase [Caldithrix abyssi DSM 13497]|uniref:Carbonic anhydrase n=1 Tax=Caldithrix abyssi DSM 13497 TaxID=880073 RepID=H1XWM8_CALAY|nr:carbonic anhydrase family protein [Caldithrix abyssi]APF17793.1 carbonic anhydrase [Caldithrix abyssi DSM 13497]EHO41866.1 carbonic anhydrase [Caldithrix abyssi DSM 13497]